CCDYQIFVSDRSRGHCIKNAFQLLIFERVNKHPAKIVKVYPRIPLPAVAKITADSKPDRYQYFFERAAFCRKDDADSQPDCTQLLNYRLGNCFFPFHTTFGKKTIARRGYFGQYFFAPISVKSNRRRRNKSLRTRAAFLYGCF